MSTTIKKYHREMKDIPELVQQLRLRRARVKDYLVPQKDLSMAAGTDTGTPGVHLRVRRDGGFMAFGVLDHAHGQVAEKCDIPKKYYDRMLTGQEDADRMLLANNVNHWLSQAPNKKRMVRVLGEDVRGFLGSTYRPIEDLDVVTLAAQVAAGKIDMPGVNFAQGARCFAWDLDLKRMDVMFVHPRVGVDLNALDRGHVLFEPDQIGPDGLYTGRKDPGTHWVFPSARYRNSEVGHGSLSVAGALLEGWCVNGNVFKAEVTQVHIGRQLNEDELGSPDTMRKENAVIFARVRDLMVRMFNPAGFMVYCRKFKGLEAEHVDHKVAADQVVKLNGLTDEVRDEILEAYLTETQHRGNLFDFQRAVTTTAHVYRDSRPDVAATLEEVGGAIIERGAAALA